MWILFIVIYTETEQYVGISSLFLVVNKDFGIWIINGLCSDDSDIRKCFLIKSAYAIISGIFVYICLYIDADLWKYDSECLPRAHTNGHASYNISIDSDWFIYCGRDICLVCVASILIQVTAYSIQFQIRFYSNLLCWSKQKYSKW